MLLLAKLRANIANCCNRMSLRSQKHKRCMTHTGTPFCMPSYRKIIYDVPLFSKTECSHSLKTKDQHCDMTCHLTFLQTTYVVCCFYCCFYSCSIVLLVPYGSKGTCAPLVLIYRAGFSVCCTASFI